MKKTAPLLLCLFLPAALAGSSRAGGLSLRADAPADSCSANSDSCRAPALPGLKSAAPAPVPPAKTPAVETARHVYSSAATASPAPQPEQQPVRSPAQQRKLPAKELLLAATALAAAAFILKKRL